MYYTAYRYYSPDSNRWLTRDPLGMVDGPNVYAYVMGNPVTMADPVGPLASMAALLATWAAVEVALLLYDLWDGYNVVADPCSTWGDYGLVALGIIMSLGLPGGGYGGILRRGARYSDDVLDGARSLAGKPFRKTIASGGSGPNRIHKISTLQAHGGRAGDWRKKIGMDPDSGQEWHWYENEATGMVRGIKKQERLNQMKWIWASS